MELVRYATFKVNGKTIRVKSVSDYKKAVEFAENMAKQLGKNYIVALVNRKTNETLWKSE